MNIYDTFMFFNEYDLLEIRLNTLDKVVDKFVLVESNKTFNNDDKEFNYEKNKERYAKFQDKIIHIKVEEHPDFTNAWSFEHYQRNHILKGIKEAQDDDIIIIADVDEIPNPKTLNPILTHANTIKDLKVIIFNQYEFYYYLNNLRKNIWTGTKVCHKKLFEDYTPQQVRCNVEGKNYKDAGWHFSYLGGKEAVKLKLQSFSHQEYNNEETFNKIENSLDKGVDMFERQIPNKFIPISDIHPQYIIDNQDKYKHLIKKL